MAWRALLILGLVLLVAKQGLGGQWGAYWFLTEGVGGLSHVSSG